MLVEHHCVTAGDGEAESVALFCPSGEESSAVIFLILSRESCPPSRIDIPRPPAYPDVVRLLAHLELRARVALVEGPRVVSGFGVHRDMSGYGDTAVGVDCPEQQPVRAVGAHGPLLRPARERKRDGQN